MHYSVQYIHQSKMGKLHVEAIDLILTQFLDASKFESRMLYYNPIISPVVELRGAHKTLQIIGQRGILSEIRNVSGGYISSGCLVRIEYTTLQVMAGFLQQ